MGQQVANEFQCRKMFCDARRTQQLASNYNMSNQQLPTTDQQDLGIIITKDLKWQKQTEISCKTANGVLGFIALNFRYKNKELILKLGHYTNP